MTESPTPTSTTETNIAALTHAGGIIFFFVPSLIVWLLKKDESPFITYHAKEALNFQMTVALGFIIAHLLSVLLIGLLLYPIIIVGNLIFCIIAAVKTSDGKDYRYPISIRLIK